MDDPERIPTEEEVKPVLAEILANCDFEHTTLKTVMKLISEQLAVDLKNLKDRKKYIKSEVEMYIETNYKPEEDDTPKRKAKKEPKIEEEHEGDEEEEMESEESDVEDEGETRSRRVSTKKRSANSEWVMKYGKKGHKVSLTNLEKPVVLQKPLADFLGTKVMQRTHVAKRITEYVKQHNLQDSADRRNIKSDDKLKALFGESKFTFFSVTKMLAPLLTKRSDVEDKELQALCNQCEADALKEKQRIYDEKVANGEPIGKTKVSTGRATKKSRRNSTPGGEKRKQPDYKLSEQLAEVCGGDVMPRTQVVKQIWAYIRENSLSQNGKIKTDSKLQAICDGVEEMGNFDINKYLSAHLTKL